MMCLYLIEWRAILTMQRIYTTSLQTLDSPSGNFSSKLVMCVCINDLSLYALGGIKFV
jgi:hypothetical protein